ncbi:LOW QUALITY PROTEIN: hypothetical protein HID58_069734, partial [Brassica napus]
MSGQVVVAQVVRKSGPTPAKFSKSKNAINATLSLAAWLRRQRTKTKAEKLLTTGVGLIQRIAKKGNVCGDDLAVDNRENKEGKVEEGGAVKTAPDNLPQQICLIEDTRTLSVEQNGNNRGAHEDVAAEDEGDDIDHDYNGWHDYCRNDCVTDDDDDFVEGPGKGRSGGQSGGKGIRRPGGTGAAKSACARDLGSPSRLDTEVTETEVGVDVVLVTPPQSKNKHTRVTEDNDDDAVVDTPIPQPAAFQGEEVLTKAGDNVSGTPTDVGCAPNQATEAVESGDICLETPPKQYNTHN